MSYAADKQTDKQTNKQTDGLERAIPTPSDIVSVGNNIVLSVLCVCDRSADKLTSEDLRSAAMTRTQLTCLLSIRT